VKVVILGDSWGAGFNASNGNDDGWVGFPCVMAAIDGSTAAQWAADTNGWLSAAKKHAVSADTIIISLLGNDTFDSFNNEGMATKEEEANAYRDLRFVVEQFTEKRLIVMLYAPPRSGDQRASMACASLNDLIKASLAGIPVEFADLGLWLTPDQVGGGLPPHPFDDGWRVIRKNMTALVELDKR